MSRSEGAWLNWTEAATPSSANRGHVLCGEKLCVLDAGPQPSPVLTRLLERVERIAVRGVADRMHGDRPPGPCTATHDLGQLVTARDLDP